MDPNDGRTSASSREELLSQVLHLSQLTVDAAGGGVWTWEDGTAWQGPSDRAGFIGASCGDESYQYTVHILGPAEPDPGAAAARVAEVWQRQGWRVRTVFSSPRPDVGIEIAVEFAAGGGVGYTVTNEISGIDAQSACSKDPGMLTPSK